jgi:N-dimethylarginine dimethylaminohydrolase
MPTATTQRYGAQSMSSRLRRVLVNRPGPAFAAAHETPGAHYAAAVDIERAQAQHDALVELLRQAGAEVELLGAESSPDSVYTYDPAIVCDGGAVVLRIGKPVREPEAPAMAAWFRAHDVPVLAELTAPATADGGDMFWLDERTLCIGRTLRTNDEGIRQVSEAVRPFVDEVRVFDMPFDEGPTNCLHLMSAISPVDRDLAVVYRPLLPAGLHHLLVERGVQTVEVPPEEWPTLGPNVLALAPREAVIFADNPRTAAGLRAAGCTVHEIAGDEIGVKGSGGPTCLTRPILRG